MRRAGQKPSFCIEGADEIVRRLAPELRAGDVVATCRMAALAAHSELSPPSVIKRISSRRRSCPPFPILRLTFHHN